MNENKNQVEPENQVEPKENMNPKMTPIEAAEKVSHGVFKLSKPIMDGEQEYTELKYDFNNLTGWELARAIDSGSDRTTNANGITDTQALALFAAAAAKSTGGLDAIDIRDRLSAMDAITAISITSIFFRGSLLAGSMRITKE